MLGKGRKRGSSSGVCQSVSSVVVVVVVVVVDYGREKEVEGKKGEDELGKREPTSCALNDIKQRSPNRFVIRSGFGVSLVSVGGSSLWNLRDGLARLGQRLLHLVVGDGGAAALQAHLDQLRAEVGVDGGQLLAEGLVQRALDGVDAALAGHVHLELVRGHGVMLRMMMLRFGCCSF